MLIDSIQLSGFGRFREPVRLGPFAPGLNILAQPNEWGKSTVLHALCRALFDRYSSRSEEIQQLRPMGTSLSPRIELCFTAGSEKHRLIKQFLDGRSCELSRWHGGAWERTDESDKADQRVRVLLGAPPLEGRARPETWGLIRYLWCRQDEPAEWPCWQGDCGEQTRSKLATVEIDTMMRNLAAQLNCLGLQQFTERGTVKRGSPLQLAEAEAEAALEELVTLRQRRSDLEQLEQQYTAARAALPRLERECAECQTEAAEWQAQAEAVGLLQSKIAVGAAEFQQAEAALQNVQREREKLAQSAAELTKEQAIQLESERRAQEAEAVTQRTELRLSEARAATHDREEARTKRQDQLTRVRAQLEIRQRAERLALLMVSQNHVNAALREVELGENELAQWPALSDKELKRARELESEVARLRAQLSAAGLSVRLEPAAASRISSSADRSPGVQHEIAAGAAAPFSAARTLTLELSGWGRVVIESGAQETAQLQSQTNAFQQQLTALLVQAGAASLAEAEAGALQAREWQAKLKVAQARQMALLTEWKSPAALSLEVAKTHKELEKSRAVFQFSEEEQARSEISLQVEEQTLAAGEAAEKKEEKRFTQELERLREALVAARAQAAESTQQVAVSRSRVKMLGELRASLLQQYASGLEPALLEAQKQFMRAEARLVTMRGDLPPDAEKMAERAARAARAASQVAAESSSKQREVDHLKTRLEERGGDGLFAREEDAAERLEAAQARAAVHRRAGLAARLLGELIERRDKASISAVLSPLEERLTQTFAQLTGVTGRRVWFDEHLAVAGIGERREELIPFDDMSRGAREQLLLALRAAIALQVTATEGPQCLVLDDVLVHTDAARHENVLDFLQKLSSQVQVLLLTCHAERYRGLGQVVPVQHSAPT